MQFGNAIVACGELTITTAPPCPCRIIWFAAARVGQGDGRGPADAVGGTGHERDPAGEREGRGFRHFVCPWSLVLGPWSLAKTLAMFLAKDKGPRTKDQLAVIRPGRSGRCGS